MTTPRVRRGAHAPGTLSFSFLAPALLAALILTLGTLEGASAETQISAAPPEIAYGKSRCANCSMFIREPDHAAALTAQDGPAVFCDIGCLLISMARNGWGAGVEATFVRDGSSGRWIEGRTAFFVQADLWTPMRFGLFAFADEPAARRFAAEHQGRTLTWEEATHLAVHAMMERHGHGSHHGGHPGGEHGGHQSEE